MRGLVRPALTACVLTIALSVTMPGSASAADAETTGRDLEKIEERIDTEKSAAEKARAKADVMARDIVNLQDDLVSAAKAVQRHEAQVAEIHRRLKALERLRKRKTADLREGRAKFGRVLSAMQRLAQYPPEALIAQPIKPADTVRTAILLRAAVSEIDDQATKLREDLSFLIKARVEIKERERALTETTELLDRERRHLSALMARKKVLKRRADKDARVAERRIAKLAEQAKTLKDFLKGIARERKRAAEQAKKQPDAVAKAANTVRRALRPISKARGDLSQPVVGRVTGRYGEKTDAGFSRKGITIATPAGAQVTATFDGIVAYAGKFRGYGLLLIIDHGEGYHTLLAGMTRVDVEQGQQLLAGEPVGVMESNGAGQPVLYVELRRDGQPINPKPWLAARKGEVNG